MTGVVVAVTFFFQLMQDYGTDQTTVQRLMATPTLRGISRAIIFNAVVDFFIIGLLLFIGIGLFAYYHHIPDLLPEGVKGDRLLPYYILHALPDGVSGLLDHGDLRRGHVQHGFRHQLPGHGCSP